MELRSQLIAKLKRDNDANLRVKDALMAQNREVERLYDDQNEEMRRKMVERSKEEERMKKELVHNVAKENLTLSLKTKQRIFEQDYENRRQWMNSYHQPDPFGSHSIQHIKKVLDRTKPRFRIEDAYRDGQQRFERDLVTERLEQERSYSKSIRKSVDRVLIGRKTCRHCTTLLSCMITRLEGKDSRAGTRTH